MNEELLNELSDAMRRRDKANAAIVRWAESKADAEEDIAELSARIAGVEAEAPMQPEQGTVYPPGTTEEFGYPSVHE